MEVEQQAMELGWVPKEQWKGDEGKWVDAQTYIDKGEKILPIVLKDRKELKEKLRQSDAELAQVKKDMVDFRNMNERQRVKEVGELTAQIDALRVARAQAITDGEGTVAVEAEEDIKKLEADKATLEAAKKPAAGEGVHPEFPAWLAENAWYKDDPVLVAAANGLAHVVAADYPNLKGRAFFEEVKKEVVKLDIYKKRYPSKAGADHSIVEGSDTEPSSQTRSRSNGKAKSYDNLPSDAKAQCDRYIKEGMITDRQGKTLAEKRAAYAAEYDWS